MIGFILIAAGLAATQAAPPANIAHLEHCNRIEIGMAKAAADPGEAGRVADARVQSKALAATAEAVAMTTGGVAGGLAAEGLRAAAAERIAGAERRQMREIDLSSASLDALEAEWEREGCR